MNDLKVCDVGVVDGLLNVNCMRTAFIRCCGFVPKNHVRIIDKFCC